MHTARTYPLQSPNGSTILLYGHENGVRVVWRGGRPFKAPQAPTQSQKKTNGTQSNIISLDDDDEDMGPPAFVDNPEFEEDEEEYDPSHPYPSILQTLDLYFGTDVMSIAVLPSSILTTDGTLWNGLREIKQKLIFAASCADSTVRLVTLPLQPPSPESKARDDFKANFTQANAGNGSWGESVVSLVGHRKPSDGVAITADFIDGKRDARSAVLIVASHSREVTGSLFFYRVPLAKLPAQVQPFQTILLGSPTKSIAFNPSLSEHLSSQLLVADSTGVCRIYNYKLLIRGPPSEEDSNSLVAEQGTWLVSLYPGYQNSKSENRGAHASFGRKTILDAKWVSGGKAILVLLNDGEWGIWDIEGVGPAAPRGLLGGQGIKGGSRSEFSLTGFIEGANKSRVVAPPQAATSKFVPMTPGTRKSTEPFSSKYPSGPIRGQISVIEVPSSSAVNPSDESIVFWLGESFTTIPTLSKYWAANARKSSNGGNLFNGTPGGRIIRLESIDLQGERCSGIDQLPRTKSSGMPADLLILGEHRFAILSAGKLQPFQVSTRMALVEKVNTSNGELDVVGIDQALAQMENGPKRRLLQ